MVRPSTCLLLKSAPFFLLFLGNTCVNSFPENNRLKQYWFIIFPRPSPQKNHGWDRDIDENLFLPLLPSIVIIFTVTVISLICFHAVSSPNPSVNSNSPPSDIPKYLFPDSFQLDFKSISSPDQFFFNPNLGMSSPILNTYFYPFSFKILEKEMLRKWFVFWFPLYC